MAIITGVTRARGLVYVYADGRLLTALNADAAARFPLAEDDAIDETAYLDRVAAYQCAAAYEKSIDLLAASAKTVKQMKDALKRKGFVEQAAGAAVARLIERGLLDDAAYARRMVELDAARPTGAYALKRKLMQKGVDAETAEEALAALDPDAQVDKAKTVAKSLARRYAGDDAYAARRKLTQALARRGFSWDEAIEAANGCFADDGEDDL